MILKSTGAGGIKCFLTVIVYISVLQLAIALLRCPHKILSPAYRGSHTLLGSRYTFRASEKAIEAQGGLVINNCNPITNRNSNQIVSVRVEFSPIVEVRSVLSLPYSPTPLYSYAFSLTSVFHVAFDGAAVAMA